MLNQSSQPIAQEGVPGFILPSGAQSIVAIIPDFRKTLDAIDNLMVGRLKDMNTIYSQIGIDNNAKPESTQDPMNTVVKNKLYSDLGVYLSRETQIPRALSDRFWDCVIEHSEKMQQVGGTNEDTTDMSTPSPTMDKLYDDLVRLLAARIMLFRIELSIPGLGTERLFNKQNCAPFEEIFTQLDAICMQARGAKIGGSTNTQKG